MNERHGRMPGSHGPVSLFTPHPAGEHSVPREHAPGGAGVGTGRRLGWQPRQRGARVGRVETVRSDIGAPVGFRVLQATASAL